MVFTCFAILTASGLFGLRASIFHLMTLVWQGYAIASCEESGEWELALDRHPANLIIIKFLQAQWMFPGMIQVSFAEIHKSFLPGSHVRNERGEVRTWQHDLSCLGR